jgi:hypothetical protein
MAICAGLCDDCARGASTDEGVPWRKWRTEVRRYEGNRNSEINGSGCPV